jgi:acyl carrier protein
MWSDGVVESAVVAEQREARPARLVAHIAGESLPTDEDLRRMLYSKVPPYMVPQAFVRHARLPRSGNSKVDYGALPLSDVVATPHETPTGDREIALATIWQELLSLEGVGRQDDFFVLGGSSLLAMQLIARIRRDLGISAEIADLFEAPRIADLARRLEIRATAGTADAVAIAPRRRARVELPT